MELYIGLNSTHFETGGTPIDKLNRSFRLYSGDRGVDVFGNHITSEEHAACHVLPVPWVTFNHLIVWFETSVRDLGHLEYLEETYPLGVIDKGDEGSEMVIDVTKKAHG